ncbi:hypothetical protein ACNKHW_14480 [Shigella flexneri]
MSKSRAKPAMIQALARETGIAGPPDESLREPICLCALKRACAR